MEIGGHAHQSDGGACNKQEYNADARTSAVVRKLADAVKAEVHNLLADGVVAAGKIVGSILLAANQLLWVEQLTVGASAHLVNDSGLQGHTMNTQSLVCAGSKGFGKANSAEYMAALKRSVLLKFVS